MTTTTVERLAKGDEILYPCWDATTCTEQPRTIASFVEYPETRVLYFAEGGYGVADRTAAVSRISWT